jgi:Putative addiction module component
MTLPSESRARLADLLVESLNADEFGRIDRLWAAEATRRRDEVRAGLVETVPGEKALLTVRDSIGKRLEEPSGPLRLSSEARW